MSERSASILVVANPAAGNGTGTQAARRAMGEMEAAIARGKTSATFADAEVDAAFLSSPEQTRDVVEKSGGIRAVIAIGGDGLAHLVVNALMSIPAEERPVFGIIAAGTGNDYARALGLPLDVRKCTQAVLHASPRLVDVGLCNDIYFAETLSFGLDAAIALDTVERRAETGRSDAGVYVSSGIDQLRHNLVDRHYRADFDGKQVEGQSITFAVQIGPYYGGGFKICPEATLDDGTLDICISHPPAGVARAIYIFMRAKNGKHVGMKPMEFLRAHHAIIDFDEEPPCQIDGEPLHATHFDISCEHQALRVLA